MSEHNGNNEPGLYGMLAEFERPDDLIAAVKKAKEAGYERMDGLTPYPVTEVADELGYPKSEMGAVMFLGGLLGVTAGFLMMYWTQAIDYPWNVAGRPFNSWPMFIPISFEMTILTSALSGLFGLIALCGLPRLNHPLFGVEAFSRVAYDRFYLCIEADDPKFDETQTRDFLNSLNPLSVSEVPQ